jgi:chorismate mutase
MSTTTEDAGSGSRGPASTPAATNGAATNGAGTSGPAVTSAAAGGEPDKAVADSQIAQFRDRIDEIDAAMIRLWQERAGISQAVGRTRIASGGTRLVLAREREILDRFRNALGADGTQLALLVLRAGRGPL